MEFGCVLALPIPTTCEYFKSFVELLGIALFFASKINNISKKSFK